MRFERGPTIRRILATALVLLPLWAGAAAAEPVVEDPEAAAVETLREIRDELRGIADVLGQVEEHQQLTTLMARMRLKQQRMEAIEDKLRDTRSKQEAMEEQIGQLTAVEETWAEGDSAFDVDALDEDERRNLELLRRERERITELVESLRLSIVETENDLAAAEDELRTLEEAVDERLGLR